MVGQPVLLKRITGLPLITFYSIGVLVLALVNLAVGD